MVRVEDEASRHHLGLLQLVTCVGRMGCHRSINGRTRLGGRSATKICPPPPSCFHHLLGGRCRHQCGINPPSPYLPYYDPVLLFWTISPCSSQINLFCSHFTFRWQDPSTITSCVLGRLPGDMAAEPTKCLETINLACLPYDARVLSLLLFGRRYCA